MLNRGVTSVLVVLLAMTLGCAADNTANLSKPTEVVTWPALKALNDPSLSMSLFMPSQMGDFKTCRKNVSDAKLEDLLSAFEAEAIPSNFASPARDEAKQKVVAAYKAVIANAKGNGSDADLKKALDDVRSGLASLTDPTLK